MGVLNCDLVQGSHNFQEEGEGKTRTVAKLRPPHSPSPLSPSHRTPISLVARERRLLGKGPGILFWPLKLKLRSWLCLREEQLPL